MVQLKSSLHLTPMHMSLSPRQTNYFRSVVSIHRNKILFTFALKLVNKRFMICLCKAAPCIRDHNYLVFSLHFQLCKIIIAIANCAVQIAFSHQKNKGDKLIVHQTFFSNKTDISLLNFRSP